jgi:hypothetical protein
MVILLVCIVQLYQDPSIILACGLFAFIGADPTTFSVDKFNILGWFNDSRGGDACGRVVGNICQHGTGLQKTYKEFAVENKFPAGINTYNTILGHCRKASSGGVNEIYAQPIVLRKSDVNLKAIKDTQLKKAIKALNPEDIVFSGIHNGTVTNYRDLAPRYGIPTEDHNDSKVLLSALFYGNLDVLSKYIGTAALVWHNHITNKTYLFKGESRTYSDLATLSEERPLYCWFLDDNNRYVSSMEDSLSFIGAEADEIIDLAPNTVFVYKDGVRQKSIKIDRSKASQYSYTVPVNYSSVPRNYDPCSMMDNYDELPFDIAERRYNTSGVIPFTGRVEDSDINRNLFVRIFDLVSEPFRLQAEINDSCMSTYPRAAIFNKGRYWMSGALMHGVYLLNSIGQIPTKTTKDTSLLKPYYFIEGIMIDSAFTYNRAKTMHGDFMNDCYNDIGSLQDFEQLFTTDVLKYSRFPTCSLTKVTGMQDIHSTINTKDGPELYDGSFQALFSNRRYICKKGTLSIIMVAPSGIKTSSYAESDSISADEYYHKCRLDRKNLDDDYVLGYELIENENDFNPLSPFQTLLFSLIDFQESFPYRVLLVHYLRDFAVAVRSECKYCPNLKTHNLNTCISCKTANLGLSVVRNLCRYDKSRIRPGVY